MTKAQRGIKRKLRELSYANEIGNVLKVCRYFGTSREVFYLWKRANEQHGKKALVNSKSCPAGLRIDDDPVTHVNFFSLNSFLSLFAYYGFRILEQKQTISSYGNSYKGVIWVVAQVDEQSSPYLQPPDTSKMLYPTRLYSFIKLFRINFEGKIRYRLNKL